MLRFNYCCEHVARDFYLNNLRQGNFFLVIYLFIYIQLVFYTTTEKQPINKYVYKDFIHSYSQNNIGNNVL